ncbi:hypothetical protein ACJIZ3_012952 [Penstemon smallii]|uniref:Uncharacterized protein n=1 Tax=Penstemon smallii TaxID=265156 RepID=A0ABD3UPU6_9LAMI
MHARHRNGPGNGYRSSAMGMGRGGAASRISPDGSMRGQRMYNSEYRNYNRGGYGRGGHSKQFQPPLPPPRETYIFVEAGRLAAEYLVSKGVLPPNALSGKWQNDGLKNQVDFQHFRPREVENAQIPVDGRTAAHSRLGNASLDGELARRRYSDEYNSMGSRNAMGGGRRSGSFKIQGSEVNKELGISGSWAGRSRASPSMEADTDASAGHHYEQSVGKDGNGGLHDLSPGEITEEGVSGAHLETEAEKCDSGEDVGAKASTIGNEKYLPSDASGEPAKECDDAKFNAESETVEEEKNDDTLEQKNEENKEVTASAREDSLASECDTDLMKNITFLNLPSEARSLLTTKGSKSDQDSMDEDKNMSERELSKVSGVDAKDVAIDSSSGNASSFEDHELKSLESDVLNAATLEKELDVTYTTRPEQSLRSGSSSERTVYKDQEADEGLSGFGSSNSLFMDKSGKRAIDEDIDGREGFKKLREWVPTLDAQFDGSPLRSCSKKNQPTLQELRTSQTDYVNLSDDEKSLNISLFPKGHADSCDFMEEKQLFPGSFKTCDLNLVGTCDVNENHDVANPLLVFQSVAETGKEVAPIDVDLSMSNNCNLPNKNTKHGINNNDIEIIDLDNESAEEDKNFSNPERRGDTVFTDLDGFHDNVNNTNEIPDVQDGYGLMISELLGNDIPNSSSVGRNLNSLHSHMDLPNGEGILGDDDSIYMSLGEIPISLLGPWEQPTQDYGKPF